MTKKTHGVIAAGHPKTAEAGQLILAEGGNAFDAAIASLLAAFVVESTLTSPAGGGFFLAHTQDNRNILFDFFSQTPRQKKPLGELDFYPVEINFGDASQIFHIGLGSMAVPGNMAGVFKVHQTLGRLPLKIVAQPAIDYGKNGFIVNSFQALCLQLLAPIFLNSPEGRKIYAPQGKLPSEGAYLRLPELATSLNFLVEEGIREFYQGEIAQKLVKDCQEKGGYLTKEDLLNYQVILRKPLQTSYRHYQVSTNPPPSSGGILISFALKLLEKFKLSNFKFGDRAHLTILAETMNLANKARKAEYDRFLHQDNIEELFISEEKLAFYQQKLTKNIANKLGSTTHISVMDNEGNAASVTTSNGEGSSYLLPGTGIMVNNMLGEEDLNPHGFHQWECNQRISSMMSPSILLSNNQPEIVLGSGGSNRIRTAILQVISNLIDFQMSLAEAVASPRVHWENQIFNLEPPLLRDEIEPLIVPEVSKVVLWREKNMFFGGVHAVRKTARGFEGAGDPRREGIATIDDE
jgi:gamma-glutamyltranspeptidase/glutathione hydrolase